MDEKITQEEAQAMRKILRAHKKATGHSDFSLAWEITDVTGTDLKEESLRRFLEGLSTPRHDRLRAIRAYLQNHNPETALRARLTRKALMLSENLWRT